MAVTNRSATSATPAVRAPKKGFLGWLDKRLPVNEFIESQLTGYYAPKNFNIWYFFGFTRAGGAGAAARHRHLPHDVLQAGRGDLVRLGRVHHARGRLRAG